MEYVFSYENRKILIYSAGNNIYYNVIFGNKITQIKAVSKDYHMGLCCMKYKNDIYCTYITVARELVWQNMTEDERLILFADVNDLWNMENLKSVEINDMPALMFQAQNPVTKEGEIRCIFPNEDKKIYSLVNDKKGICGYEIVGDKEKIFVCYTTNETKDKRIFMVTGEKNNITLKEYVLSDLDYVALLRDRCIQIEEKFNSEKEKIKKEYDAKTERDMKYIEENYRRQYEELEKLTKDIQNEGKRWREMYYKAVAASPKRQKQLDINQKKS